MTDDRGIKPFRFRSVGRETECSYRERQGQYEECRESARSQRNEPVQSVLRELVVIQPALETVVDE